MATTSTRVSIDCREFPSEKNCSLYMSGTAEEVTRAAIEHAVSAHGHKNTPELAAEIKAQLKPEAA